MMQTHWRVRTTVQGAAAVALAVGLTGGVAVQLSAQQQVSHEPYASSYQPRPSQTTVIRGATILTAAGPAIENGDVLMVDGRIRAVGRNLDVPADAVVVNAAGLYVTPGIIDAHSHLGVSATPAIPSLSNTNEMTAPVTAQVWVEHSVWPHDPGFPLALAGGITTLQILPGSGNLIGGRTVTLRNVPATTVQGMKFPGAPQGLKMACGENPKRVYGGRTQTPSTSMANVAGYRAAWVNAQEYRAKWDKWAANGSPANERPERKLDLETLAGVLRGEILVHNHCYRADEMAWMLDIADEFGYTIRSFHHAVEAYKIPELLRSRGVATSIWADWWGFKMEAMDAVVAAGAISHNAGVRVIVHSDDGQGIQRLNQETAKIMGAAHATGLHVSDDDAIRWITANPAWALGVEQETGSIEVGKRADVVIWSRNPFSVYAVPEKVYIDGALLYDRNNPAGKWRTDFELGFRPI